MSAARWKRNRHRPMRMESLERRIMLDAAWQNPARPLDVNNDGQATPLDALMVVNLLNRNSGVSELPSRSHGLEPYYDTDGNGRLAPLDALLTINALNRGLESIYSSDRVEGGSEPGPAGFSSRLLGTLPGDRSQLIRISTSISQGEPTFNELGLFVVEDEAGTVDGLAPGDPGYADAVFRQARRRVLYSRLGTLKTESSAEFSGGLRLGVYVLQRTTTRPDAGQDLFLLNQGGEEGLGALAVGWQNVLVELEQPQVANHAPVLDPFSSRTINITQDRLQLEIQASDPDDDPLQFIATASVANPLAEIRQTYGLRSGGEHLFNLVGLNEKWLLGEGETSFFILPNGDLIEWRDSFDQTAGRESLIARLDSSIYADPSLLWDAAEEIFAPATVLVDGNALTIDPYDGVHGELRVRVAASDGLQFDSQEFSVTIEPAQPTFEEEQALVSELMLEAESLTHEEIPSFIAELSGVAAKLDGVAAAQANDLLRRLDRLYADTELKIQASEEWEAEQERLLALELEIARSIETELALLQSEYRVAWETIKDSVVNVVPVDPLSIPPIFIHGGGIRTSEVEQGHRIDVDLSAIHPFGIPEYELEFVSGPGESIITASLDSESGIFSWTPGAENVPGIYRFRGIASTQIVTRENDYPGVSFPSVGEWVHAEVELTVDVTPAVAPTLGSVTISPSVITDSNSDPVVVTALGVSHATERVDFVRFWQEINGNASYEYGIDRLLGFDTDGDNGWSIMATPLVEPGSMTVSILAQAERLAGVSNAVAATLEVIPAVQLPENLVMALGRDESAVFEITSPGATRRYYFDGDSYVSVSSFAGELYAQWYDRVPETGQIVETSGRVTLFGDADDLNSYDVAVNTQGHLVVVAGFNHHKSDEVRAVFAAKPAGRFDSDSYVREFASSLLEQYLPMEDTNGNPVLDENGEPIYDFLPTGRGGNFQVAAELNGAGVGFVTWDYEIPWRSSYDNEFIEVSGDDGNLIPFQWQFENGQPSVRSSYDGAFVHQDDTLMDWENDLVSAFGPHSLASLSENGRAVLLWPSSTGPHHIGVGRIQPGFSGQPSMIGFHRTLSVELSLNAVPTHIAVGEDGWVAIGADDQVVLVSPAGEQVGEPFFITDDRSLDHDGQVSRMHFDADGTLVVDYRTGSFYFQHERYLFEVHTVEGVYLQSVARADNAELHAGGSFEVDLTLRNDTSSAADDLQVAFYLSRDDRLNADTIQFPENGSVATVPADRLVGYRTIEQIGPGVTEAFRATLSLPENLDPIWMSGAVDLKLFSVLVNSGTSLAVDIPYVVAKYQLERPSSGRGFGEPDVEGGVYIRPNVAASQVSDPNILNSLDRMELIGRQMASSLRSLENRASYPLRGTIRAMRHEMELSLDAYFQKKWDSVIAARNAAVGLAEQQRSEAESAAQQRYERDKAAKERWRDQQLAPNQAAIDAEELKKTSDEINAKAERDAKVLRQQQKIAQADAALEAHLQSESGLGLWGLDDGVACFSDPGACYEQAKEEFNRLKEDLEDALQTVSETATNLIKKAEGYLVERLAVIQSEFEKAVEPFQEAIEGIEKAFQEGLESLGNTLSTAIQGAKSIYDQTVADAKEIYADELEDLLKTDAIPVFDKLDEKIGSAIASIGDSGIAQQIQQQLDNLSSSNPLGPIAEIVANGVEFTTGIATESLANIGDSLGPAISDLKDSGGEFAEWAKDTGGKAADWTQEAGADVAAWAEEHVGDLLNEEIIAFRVCTPLEASLNFLNGSVYFNVEVGPGLEYGSRKVKELFSGQLSLPDIDPLEAISTFHGYTLNETTDYQEVRDDQYEEFGPQNVYFSSRRFVTYLGVETVAEIAAESLLLGGEAAEDAMAELAEQVRLELNDVLAWLQIKGQAQMDELAAGLIQSLYNQSDYVTPHIELRWTPVTFRYELLEGPVIGKAVQAITGGEKDLSDLIDGRELAVDLPHAGFAIIWKSPEVENPLSPQAIDAALSGYVADFSEQQFSGKLLSGGLMELATARLRQAGMPEELLKFVSVVQGGSLDASEFEGELSQRLRNEMGLSEEMLTSAFSTGNVILDLSSIPIGSRLADLLDELTIGNSGSASIDTLEFNVSTFSLDISATLCHQHSWGSISSILGFGE